MLSCLNEVVVELLLQLNVGGQKPCKTIAKLILKAFYVFTVKNTNEAPLSMLKKVYIYVMQQKNFCPV